MDKFKKKKQPNIKLRYNMLSFLVYLIGVILIAQLFNLQIVNGSTYREISNTRLTRESTLYAARGDILDRNGSQLATSEMTFSLEIYKTKLENSALNNTILAVLNTLEANGDEYIDTFPISIDPFEYTFSSEEKRKAWLENWKLKPEATPEEAFYYFKEKYEIEQENINEIRKILVVRYRISSEGYSSTKSITISNNISRNSVLILDEQSSKYPGIDVIAKSQRSYPNGNIAPHIIGYISSINSDQYQENKDAGYTMNDLYGQSGIEYVFEKYLRGQNGIKQIDMSVDGDTVSEYTEKEAIAGSNVVLTIDANLQAVTEQALANAIQNASSISKGASASDAGAIVVMNVNTGEVLAMASYPNYEPSSWIGGIDQDIWKQYNSNESNNPLINRAISGVYAPGSTYKMVTATAALQTGNVSPTEKVNDTGIYPRGHKPVCWIYSSRKRGHGYLNVTDAIKHSCNFFFYEMGYRIGIETLDQYARAFGFGSKTGIELPAETEGGIASPENAEKKGETWTVGYTLSAAIGQEGNCFSPIQMAKYISILVNGGKQVNPTIIKTILNKDGTEVTRNDLTNSTLTRLGGEPNNNEDIQIDEVNKKAIMEGMKGVTSESGGTAYGVFGHFNIEVGGKTGTAQTGDGSTANALFVGFAPYDNPEIAVACVIENGGDSAIASYPARDVIAQYFGMNETNIDDNISALPSVEMQN